ncbi:secreted RxLR effector protein 161-like [Belonocnema kinseyi]|uniref:secreted RxLR effector protein 161-like n=1 Tax=Belonocnema kinseyi TaxID=2817044 RepID=UPI00143E0009|nr:secreted RxLR effector protein 161-like [Belonocnema kinseyi]
MFLAIVSCPDIAYAVNVVSRYLSEYTESHWQAVKRILRYLIGTADFGIMYKSCGSKLELRGYSDADYAGDVVMRRSTTGYVFMLAGGPITWSSQRQKLVTLSTTETEYFAAATATKEAVWLRKLLDDIGFQAAGASALFVDNQSAIKLIKNPEFHKRTKHIDVRYHFIRF